MLKLITDENPNSTKNIDVNDTAMTGLTLQVVGLRCTLQSCTSRGICLAPKGNVRHVWHCYFMP